jgi:hypothetical protein
MILLVGYKGLQKAVCGLSAAAADGVSKDNAFGQGFEATCDHRGSMSFCDSM